MKKLAIGLVLVSGCQWVDKLKSPPPKVEAENPLPADAHAEFVEGSIHFVDDRGDLKLAAAYWDNVSNTYGANALTYKLTGPDGEHDVSWYGGFSWKSSWPAGTYKIACFAFGKEIGEREFTVATPANGRGERSPTVVTNERHVISGSDGELFTYLPINVATPTYAVEFVWMRDHHVVKTNSVWMPSASLSEMSDLGKYIHVDIPTKSVSDAGSATVVVFVSGTGLYGAWSWTKDQQVEWRSLPAATLSGSDLSLSRAAARKSEESDVIHETLVGGSHAEALACAVASDDKVRDVFADYAHKSGVGGIDDRDADEKLGRAANDDSLTERQRARLREDAAGRRDAANNLSSEGEASLAKAIQLSRKYKNGCLAAMGVPTLPALATR